MTRHAFTLRTATLALGALAACSSGTRDSSPSQRTGSQDSAAVNVPAPAAPKAAAAPGAMLDPNAATREQLLAIPGMTAAAADTLIAGRPFGDMLAVDRVLARQIGAAERAAVYARLWKPLDLNSAKGEEIVLIPGVGPRMRREFEEYRPYKSLEHFRREIGKYVNAAELDRLERYVTIR